MMTAYEEYLQLSSVNTDGFSASIAAMLICVQAEPYIPLFKEANIGINVLRELTDLDLILLGVDCASTRTRILDAIKQLPESSISKCRKYEIDMLSQSDITKLLIDSKRQMHMIYLSLISNRFCLMKTKSPEDVLLNCKQDVQTTDLVLKVYKDMEEILCKMESELHRLRDLTPPAIARKKKMKKFIIKSVGSAVIVALSIAFVKSLQNL